MRKILGRPRKRALYESADVPATGSVYVDERGKRWRVTGTRQRPSLLEPGGNVTPRWTVEGVRAR